MHKLSAKSDKRKEKVMVDVKEYNLDSCVHCVGYSSEEEWHELRKKGIGGSDAGAVMGLNKYTSPLKLFKIKTGEYVEDDSDNVYLKKGKDLESLIFEKYVSKDPDLEKFKIIHPEHVFINNQYPWLRANCDGIAVPDGYSIPTDPHLNIIIEIKWVSEWAEVNWDGDDYCGVPASYYAQVQHYMTVTGAQIAYLYAMFDKDWHVKRYEIPYNLSFALKMLAQTKEFYNNMTLGIAPKIKATMDKDFIPERLEAMPATTTVSEELNKHIAEYLALKEEIKALETQVAQHYDAAVERYLNGERPTNRFQMDIVQCKKSGFDSRKFAAEHPDVYDRYKTVTEYTRTTIKKR